MRSSVRKINGFIAAVSPSVRPNWPPPACAEQISTAVIGLLDEGSARNRAHFMEAFRSGLATAGYIEGRNLALEFRYADGEFRRLPELARDLVQQRVVLIAAFGNAAALHQWVLLRSPTAPFAAQLNRRAGHVIRQSVRPGATRGRR